MLTTAVFKGVGRYAVQRCLKPPRLQKNYSISDVTEFNHAECQRMLHTTNTMNKHKTFLEMCSRVIKGFKLKAFFVHDFKYREFMVGAKEAALYVSTEMSEGNMNKLEDVFTCRGMQTCLELYELHKTNPDELKVHPPERIVMKITDVDFHIGDTKLANVTVQYLWPLNFYEDFFEKQQTIWDRDEKLFMLHYSFQRDCTPGIVESSQWLIDDMKYKEIIGWDEDDEPLMR